MFSCEKSTNVIINHIAPVVLWSGLQWKFPTSKKYCIGGIFASYQKQYVQLPSIPYHEEYNCKVSLLLKERRGRVEGGRERDTHTETETENVLQRLRETESVIQRLRETERYYQC